MPDTAEVHAYYEPKETPVLSDIVFSRWYKMLPEHLEQKFERNEEGKI